MSAILDITAPFFGLILCGYVAWYFDWLPENAIPGLNRFVLFFALPCLLFKYGASLSLGDLLNISVLVVYGIAGILLVIFAIAFAVVGKSSLKEAAFGALTAASSNTGFVGVPLIVVLQGQGAIGPAISSILVDFFLVGSICLAIAEWRNAAQPTNLFHVLRQPFLNPLPWAISCGAMAHFSGIHVPESLDRMIGMLGASATPIALFLVGGVLCRARRNFHACTAPHVYLPLAAAKVFLHPMLVYVVGHFAQSLGAKLDSTELITLTLVAGLPSASNVFLLAERSGANADQIAHVILASTAVASLSFSFLAFLLL